MMALLMLGSIINYLTRATLAVAAPTVLRDLDITTQQYSWILSPFQFAIMLQPLWLVARPQQSHCYSASTVVEFEPEHFQQMAGLVCYYNSSKFHYFYVSRDEDSGKHLRVMSALPDQVTSDVFTPPIAVAGGVPIELRVEVDYERMRFAYRLKEGVWQWLPQQFDASILWDEASAPGLPDFTGAFVEVACPDLAGTAMPADFDWFQYRERNYAADVLGVRPHEPWSSRGSSARTRQQRADGDRRARRTSARGFSTRVPAVQDITVTLPQR